MVLERMTKYFQESKLILNEDGGEQADSHLKISLLLELTLARTQSD